MFLTNQKYWKWKKYALLIVSSSNLIENLLCCWRVQFNEVIVNEIDKDGEGAVDFQLFLEFIKEKVGSRTLENILLDEAIKITVDKLKVRSLRKF